MKESARNFLTGIVSIVGLAGFGFLLLLFGDINSSLRPSYPVRILANQALGLRVGSQVTMAGVPVGQVKSVRIVPNPLRPAEIVVSIDGDIDVPLAAKAYVTQSLIAGTAQLAFVLPEGTDAGTVFARDGSATLEANFESLEQKVSRLLDERLGGLDAAMGSIKSVAEEAQKWLGDEQMRADAKTAVWKAQQLIETASVTMQTITEAARGVQVSADALAVQLKPTMEQLASTLRSVERLTEQARDGKGTVGQLMSNPDLYNSLVDSAERLKRTLGEVELLMQKIRAEGLGVKF
ncbi:MAG: MCE family protein [Planctomycetes bacterium]|nr:MCE family protein [Planctomycetota bacterium]